MMSIKKIRPMKWKKIPDCDCMTGIDETSRTPHLIRCRNPAVHIVEIDGIPIIKTQTMFVCDSCLPRVKKHYGTP